MIGELHLELGLRTILAMNQAQGTTNNYLQEGGERWTKQRFSMLAGARRWMPTFSEAHATTGLVGLVNQLWVRLILRDVHHSENVHTETNGVLLRSSNRRCSKKSV